MKGKRNMEVVNGLDLSNHRQGVTCCSQTNCSSCDVNKSDWKMQCMDSHIAFSDVKIL
jgi:hypothetical protein